MTVHVSRPDHIDVRIVGAPWPATSPISLATAIGTAIRGLVVGVAIGLVLVSAHLGAAGVATIGAIAIAAALLSWDP